MSVVDLLQAMELGRRNGAVHVKSGGDEGTLWFRDGAPVDANAGALQGADAVYRMLTWERGSFEIDFRTPRRPEAMTEDVNTLVTEGMRQASEWSAVAEQLPPLESVFGVNYDELSERLADLPDEVNALIRLFDGRRTARDAITESGLADLKALEALSQLYFEGIVAIKDVQSEPAEPSAPVPHYETSLPPSVQPSVADALLRSVEELSARPLGIEPEHGESARSNPVPPPLRLKRWDSRRMCRPRLSPFETTRQQISRRRLRPMKAMPNHRRQTAHSPTAQSKRRWFRTRNPRGTVQNGLMRNPGMPLLSYRVMKASTEATYPKSLQQSPTQFGT